MIHSLGVGCVRHRFVSESSPLDILRGVSCALALALESRPQHSSSAATPPSAYSSYYAQQPSLEDNILCNMSSAMSEKLAFSPSAALDLEPRLPPKLTARTPETIPDDIFVTLTFATSLDSSLSLAPGVRTRLSGPGSKAMTHFLRSRHDAILVGVSTVLADNPGLNCRIDGSEAQPRPIIVDPHLRWEPRDTDKVLEICRAGEGLAPYVITASELARIPAAKRAVLEGHGGKYITVRSNIEKDSGRQRFDWGDVFDILRQEQLSSVMVEGGGQIINSLLDPAFHSLINSVIVTIAPTWLGRGGVVVSPNRVTDTEGTPVAAARLTEVSWHPFGEDVVLCGRLPRA